MSCGIVLLLVIVASSLVTAAPLNKEVPFNLSSVSQADFDSSKVSVFTISSITTFICW